MLRSPLSLARAAPAISARPGSHNAAHYVRSCNPPSSSSSSSLPFLPASLSAPFLLPFLLPLPSPPGQSVFSYSHGCCLASLCSKALRRANTTPALGHLDYALPTRAAELQCTPLASGQLQCPPPAGGQPQGRPPAGSPAHQFAAAGTDAAHGDAFAHAAGPRHRADAECGRQDRPHPATQMDRRQDLLCPVPPPPSPLPSAFFLHGS